MFPLAGDSIFGAEHDTLFAKLLESRQIHSVLTCSPFPADDLGLLADLGIPAITISNGYPTAQTPWVIEDVAQGSMELVRHLVDKLGHRRVALVMGPEGGILPQRIRSSGLLTEELLRQLLQRGVHISPARVFHSRIVDVDEVKAVAHRWLSDDNHPTAIVCVNDTLAMEVLNIASLLGLSVPGELSVATWYDEVDNSPLTAVRVPLEQMGHEAVELAARALGGELVTPSVIPVRLIARRTSGIAPE
jgi:LacI family transcriptional regulator